MPPGEFRRSPVAAERRGCPRFGLAAAILRRSSKPGRGAMATKKAAAKKAATKTTKRTTAKKAAGTATEKKAAAKRVTKSTATKKTGAAPAKKSTAKSNVKKGSTIKKAAKKATPAKETPTETPMKATPATSAAKSTDAAAAPRGLGRGTASAAKTAPAKRGPLSASDKKFFEEQRVLLLQEREQYEEQAVALKAEADQLAAEAEGESEFTEEGGDVDSMSAERERDLALASQARQNVDEIDRALSKIANGSYGICERCGETIVRARLKALPFASQCVACKSGGLSSRR